jgi:hypothetical protein
VDPNVLIFFALEGYAVVAAIVAAGFVVVLRRTERRADD